LIGAYCPHLGAHFGYGGQVIGKHIRCPFHSFEFDINGVCQSTAYGTRTPPVLAEGDGPVGKYRQWAKQFYRGADIELI